MGFYADWVVPRILNLAMSRKVVTDERKKCLAGVTGTVLEVGFGSGLNLPWYPAAVEKVVGVDPSKQGAKLARKRIAAARFAVEFVPLEGEKIDAPDASFDSVVCTYSLCTINDPAAALRQVRRVLKPGGRFFFVEHGRSGDAKVRRWQDRLNGFQKVILAGCNLNRDIEGLIREAGFALVEVDKYYLEGQPKAFGFMTRGIARVTGT
jgi:ubiquinone/menaquinone biosynthesis C-methylase UbiE